jgi:hypothetical protein
MPTLHIEPRLEELLFGAPVECRKLLWSDLIMLIS